MEATLVEALTKRSFVSASGNVGAIQLPGEVKEAEEKAHKAAEAKDGEDAEKHAAAAEKAKAAAAQAVAEMQQLEVDWVREPADEDKVDLYGWLVKMTGLTSDHVEHVWPDMPAKAKKAEHHAEQPHEGHGGPSHAMGLKGGEKHR